MDFPVFGHNNVAGSAAVAAAAPGPPAAPALAPAAGRAAGSEATSSPNGAPSGFLELALQAQRQNDYPDGSGPRHGFVNGAFGDDGFGFDDVVDAINPLQHIPIISMIYRAITGDKIDVGPSLVGGALFGGFFGFIGAAVNAAIEDSTGHDAADNVRLALFGAPDDAPREPVMFANGSPDASPAQDVAEAETAPADAAASEPMPEKMPPLTAEQLALLHEHGDETGDAAAAAEIAPAAGPGEPPAPAGPLELSPEQEALLLRSVGITPPPATSPADAPKADAASAPSANASDDGAAKPAMAGGAADPGHPAPRPVHATGVKPAGETGTPQKLDFAKRMQFGLDRYYAHRMPVNTKPPHLDVIR